MYADQMTDSMKAAIDETNRRRSIQDAYNKAHGIVPKTIVKEVHELLDLGKKESGKPTRGDRKAAAKTSALPISIPDLEKQMRQAAERLDFEKAAELRDRIRALENARSD